MLPDLKASYERIDKAVVENETHLQTVWQDWCAFLLEDVDKLRAQVAALEEAGDGLVNVLHYVQTGPETDTGAPVGPGPALARWREVKGE